MQIDQSSPSPQPQSGDAMQTLVPTKNMPALISYYCGVFGLIPFLGLPLSVAAIILAKKAFKLYEANPTPGAKGHAKTGMILGIFELTVFALFMILVLVANLNKN